MISKILSLCIRFLTSKSSLKLIQKFNVIKKNLGIFKKSGGERGGLCHHPLTGEEEATFDSTNEQGSGIWSWET